MSFNTCISYERKKKRRAVVPLTMDINLFEDKDESSKQIRLLYDRIHRLNPFDRAIVLLWLENMSYEEIGAIVGISTKNVSVRLYRIKEELKKCRTINCAIMENYVDEFELDEMKQQIQLLRDKLAKEIIVSEKLLKNSTQDKVAYINRKKRFIYF